MICWHYTCGVNIVDILRDRVIRNTDVGVESGERLAAWFSFNPIWEKTANKAIQHPDGRTLAGSKEDTRQVGGGLFRIAVDSEGLNTWNEHKKLSGISKRMADGLYRVAVKDGANPAEWLVSYRPIPQSEWLSVEMLIGEEWTKLDDETLEYMVTENA